VNVTVRQREQWAFDSTGAPLLPLRTIPGTARPADPNEQGWKETVRMNPGEVVTVDMKFNLPKGAAPPPSPRLQASYGISGAEYVWHCHILEHEEHDMMHALVVI
jgi:spore coat protein A, manganese oxidase